MLANQLIENRIKLLKEFIDQDANDTFAHYALALEYKAINNTDAALKLLIKVNDIDANYLACYYQLGKCYETKGMIEDAIFYYKEGIKMATAQKNNHTKTELQSALDELI